MSAPLGIATMAYFPFCFLNMINVLLSFVYAILGIQIKYNERETVPKEPPERAT